MDSVKSAPCYKGQFYKGITMYRKMTISWSISYNSFVKFYGKIFVSHPLGSVYTNMCYNEECCKETALDCQ